MDSPKLRIVAANEVQERDIPTFGRWLVELMRRIKTLPGLTILLTSGGTALYGAISRASYLANPKYLLPITSGVQCVIILFFVFLSRFTKVRGFSASDAGAQLDARLTAPEGCAACPNFPPVELARVKEVSVRAMRYYRNYWMILWLCWLLLYAVLTFMHLTVDKEQRVVWKVVATCLNNGAALAMLYCYLTLSRPESLGVKSDKGEGQADWFIWVATLLMLTIIEATLVHLVMAGKMPAGIAVTALGITNFFGWVSGIGSTVVMFFYMRRLASRFMVCPTWVLVFLNIYAALQPGFGLIGHDNPWETVLLLDFALVLKTLLFLYMTWVFKFGWLLYYFSQIVQFRDSATSKMKTFSRLLE